MGVTVVTGLPGNGKTLYTLWMVEKRRKEEHRPVFYSGIKDLSLEWEAIDPYEWHRAPANAIVVIDEAQRSHDDVQDQKRGRGKLFGVRPRGEEPDWVTQLEVHRHGGIDLVLLTQHPMFLSAHVRKLADRHLHLVRRFGLQSSTVHEWVEVREDCHKRRADSSKSAFRFPREAFRWYKSAEAHTMKVRVPWRIWGMGLTVLALIGLISFVVHRLAAQVRGPGVQPAGQVAPQPGGGFPGGASGGQGLRVAGQPLSRGEWVAQWEPRVSGLAYTAPVYDEATKPVAVPYPAACVVIRGGCGCWSQQGTRLDVPDGLCRRIVSGGFFVAWDAEGRRVERRPAVSSAQSVAVPALQQPQGPALVVINGGGAPAAVSVGGVGAGGVR
jgi:zona occludens toxin